MAQKESNLRNMVFSLTLIVLVASAALAGVYVITKPSIDGQEVAKTQEAIKAVLPGFSGKTERVAIKLPNDADSVFVNLAYQDGELFGGAVQTYTDKAFKSYFSLMVGFDAGGNILETEVIKMEETPGLGDKINKSKSNFSDQFVKMCPANNEFNLKVKKDGGTVDAITAATISSRAYCDAVNRAAKAFDIVTKKGANNE
ncbi:MAG TPA: RnfABCDGE type electron transport complex subunit G [Bacteroidales bacterium]|nr:RnfABCDGE type electron transport complex subunit G [Bacteroidales bacterium]HPT52525.1 RnfABCDGE type electron transport complex subunit G [Bacteroidales bacterium]